MAAQGAFPFLCMVDELNIFFSTALSAGLGHPASKLCKKVLGLVFWSSVSYGTSNTVPPSINQKTTLPCRIQGVSQSGKSVHV